MLGLVLDCLYKLGEAVVEDGVVDKDGGGSQEFIKFFTLAVETWALSRISSICYMSLDTILDKLLILSQTRKTSTCSLLSLLYNLSSRQSLTNDDLITENQALNNTIIQHQQSLHAIMTCFRQQSLLLSGSRDESTILLTQQIQQLQLENDSLKQSNCNLQNELSKCHDVIRRAISFESDDETSPTPTPIDDE